MVRDLTDDGAARLCLMRERESIVVLVFVVFVVCDVVVCCFLFLFDGLMCVCDLVGLKIV